MPGRLLHVIIICMHWNALLTFFAPVDLESHGWTRQNSHLNIVWEEESQVKEEEKLAFILKGYKWLQLIPLSAEKASTCVAQDVNV